MDMIAARAAHFHETAQSSFQEYSHAAYFGERDHGFRLNVISESGGRCWSAAGSWRGSISGKQSVVATIGQCSTTDEASGLAAAGRMSARNGMTTSVRMNSSSKSST